MEIYAHRGASAYAPENTMAAFELAGKMGADGMELDVQFTRDGKLIVLHDDRLDRTTGCKGLAMDHDFDEIRSLDAGSHFSKDFAGEKIPLLEEVLEYLMKTDMMLNIEIKTYPPRYTKRLAEETLAAIRKYKAEERIWISSFDHRSLNDFNNLGSGIPMGILYSESMYHPVDYLKAFGASAIHPWYVALDRETVDFCHANGVETHVWTVNEPEDYRRMLEWGVDIVITNKPDIAKL